MLQNPVFLKVCDVPDLPKERVDRWQQRHAKLLFREIAYEIKGVRASIDD